MNFVYQSFPIKVYFGESHLRNLPEMIREIGGQKLFVIASNRAKPIVQTLIAAFGDENVTLFSEIVQHVPLPIVEKATRMATEKQSQVIVAIGGGSAIGLAKGIALQNGLPILAIPTTYAGSEMTNTYGISSDGVKKVAKSMSVLPRTVIYAPSLTVGMPLPLAATSSMNAMAHLIEGLYAFDSNPITYQNALMGINALTEGMETLISEKSLFNANQHLQFGAYLAGKCLCEVSMALHHKMAHVLGGSFLMDHGQVHTVLLPYVLHFQTPALDANVNKDLQKALRTKNPALKLKTLASKMGAKTTLKDIAFQETDIRKASEMVMNLKKFANPVDITATNISDLLTSCYYGKL